MLSERNGVRLEGIRRGRKGTNEAIRQFSSKEKNDVTPRRGPFLTTEWLSGEAEEKAGTPKGQKVGTGMILSEESESGERAYISGPNICFQREGGLRGKCHRTLPSGDENQRMSPLPIFGR